MAATKSKVETDAKKAESDLQQTKNDIFNKLDAQTATTMAVLQEILSRMPTEPARKRMCIFADRGGYDGYGRSIGDNINDDDDYVYQLIHSFMISSYSPHTLTKLLQSVVCRR